MSPDTSRTRTRAAAARRRALVELSWERLVRGPSPPLATARVQDKNETTGTPAQRYQQTLTLRASGSG
eukprot:1319247-Rhodomonas_salina.1